MYLEYVTMVTILKTKFSLVPKDVEELNPKIEPYVKALTLDLTLRIYATSLQW